MHLAASPASDVQAFRYGEHVYGFQFHLDVDRSLIERWIAVPGNQAALHDDKDRIDPDTIREETGRSIVSLQNLSRKTFSKWIERFEIAPRRTRLPSR